MFDMVGSFWSRTGKFVAFDGAVSDEFGSSVCIYGSDLIIGASNDDDNATDTGIQFYLVLLKIVQIFMM